MCSPLDSPTLAPSAPARLPGSPRFRPSFQRSARFWRLLLALGSSILALGAVELGLRLFWASRPPVEVPRCSTLSNFGTVAGRIPEGPQHAVFTSFTGDVHGFRSTGLVPAPPEAPRVLVLGDSFVFGIGVEDDETLPARLGASLREVGVAAEVWNGGQVALGLRDSVARAGLLIPELHPDVVVLVLNGTDLDLVDVQPGLPMLWSGGCSKPRPGWLNRVGEWMVPSCSHGPPGSALPPDRRLVQGWRTWQALGLYLGRLGSNRCKDHGHVCPLGACPSPVIDPVVARSLDDPLDRFVTLARASGVRPAVVMHSSCGVEGYLSQRIVRAAQARDLPLLDLSALHPCGPLQRFRWGLGWDDHPNARSHRRSGEVIAAWMLEGGWLQGQASPVQRRALADLRAAQPDHERHVARTVEDQERCWSRQARHFSSTLSGSTVQANPEPWLWGWWPSEVAVAAGLDPGLAWSGHDASVLLAAGPGGARELVIEGQRALSEAPLLLDCGSALQPTELALPQGPFVQALPLTVAAGPGELVGCRFQEAALAGRPYPLVDPKRDPFSLGLARIELR